MNLPKTAVEWVWAKEFPDVTLRVLTEQDREDGEPRTRGLGGMIHGTPA